jgi:RimJ/RimL family protein N-acetyltransferase
MRDFLFLEGKNIYLRPFVKTDLPFFARWYNDPETRGKIGEVMPTSEHEAEEIIGNTKKDRVWFAVVRKEDDEVIGETGLLRMFPAWRTTDLTIIIPDKANQGKGYGKETIRLLMDYAFGYLNYNRIAIGVVGFNTNALEFYKRVGFKQEGIQEQGYYYNYRYYDFIMMRILRDEFLKLRGAEAGEP